MDTTSRVRYTYDDYCQLPEDDRRELIHGEFFTMTAPTEKHQRLLGNLYYLFRQFLEERDGRTYFAPFDVILDSFNVVQPDLIYISPLREQQIKKEGLRGAPNLVVEILSPSTRRRDRNLKRKLYYQFKVEELWLVDPDAETVEVLVREESELALWKTFRLGETVRSRLLTQLEFSTSKLFD